MDFAKQPLQALQNVLVFGNLPKAYPQRKASEFENMR